jgi:hypothetical protein
VNGHDVLEVVHSEDDGLGRPVAGSGLMKPYRKRQYCHCTRVRNKIQAISVDFLWYANITQTVYSAKKTHLAILNAREYNLINYRVRVFFSCGNSRPWSRSTILRSG